MYIHCPPQGIKMIQFLQKYLKRLAYESNINIICLRFDIR